MFSLDRGTPIGIIKDGEDDGEILGIVKEEDLGYDKEYEEEEGESSEFFTDGQIFPILNPNEREVSYIAAPAGAGKSFLAGTLASGWMDMHRGKDAYIVSRTDYKLDPSLKHLRLKQIPIGDHLVERPIDITKEVHDDTLVIFDDVTTIHDDKLRKAVEKMICDILEIGRKLRIWIILTSHLIIPNEKKFARTVLNEMQSLYVFPRAGSKQQISYVLKQYYGISKSQIELILNIKSRWVKVQKTAPQYVMSTDEAFIL